MYEPSRKKQRTNNTHQAQFLPAPEQKPLSSYFTEGFLSTLASSWQTPTPPLNPQEIFGPLYWPPLHLRLSNQPVIQSDVDNQHQLSYLPPVQTAYPEKEQQHASRPIENPEALPLSSLPQHSSKKRKQKSIQQDVPGDDQQNSKDKQTYQRAYYAARKCFAAKHPCPQDNCEAWKNESPNYIKIFKSIYARCADKENAAEIKRGSAAAEHDVKNKIPMPSREKLLVEGIVYADAYEKAHDNCCAKQGENSGKEAAKKNCIKPAREKLMRRGKGYADAYEKAFDEQFAKLPPEQRLLTQAATNGCRTALNGGTLLSQQEMEEKGWDKTYIAQYRKSFLEAASQLKPEDISKRQGRNNGTMAGLRGGQAPSPEEFKRQQRDLIYQNAFLKAFKQAKALYGDINCKTMTYYLVGEQVLASFYTPEMEHGDHRVKSLAEIRGSKRAAFLCKQLIKAYNADWIEEEDDKLEVHVNGPFVVIDNYDVLLDSGLRPRESLPQLPAVHKKYWETLMQSQGTIITAANVVDDDFFATFMTAEEAEQAMVEIQSKEAGSNSLASHSASASSSTASQPQAISSFSSTPYNFFSQSPREEETQEFFYRPD